MEEVIYPGRMWAYRIVRNYICAEKALVLMSDSPLREDDSREAWEALTEMLKIMTEAKERITER